MRVIAFIFLLSFGAVVEGCQTWISSQSVFDLMGFDGVVPYPSNCGGVLCGFYLSQSSCLGHLGPLSALGPLGEYGPIGTNSWNPSYWISGLEGWGNFSNFITGIGGPLSMDGPLGHNGPLSPYWYGTVMPSINDFAKHLAGHGIWSVLGPVSVLGPLGPLGPLGTIGATGFLRDMNSGDFVNGNTIERNVTVQYDPQNTRSYPLVELYSEARAQQLGVDGLQDSSFMVEGSVENDQSDTYYFTVTDYPQYVSIVVVPITAGDDFNVTLTNSYSNQPVTSAALTSMINWIQIYVTQTENYRVDVTSEGFMGTHQYRLIVVGSTSYIPKSKIKGPYINKC